MTTETLNTLIRARELIASSSNWTKGAFIRGDDRYCAVGAVRATSKVHKVRSAAYRALRAEIPGNAHGIVSYNDNQWTAHYSIVAMFDRAISKEQARPGGYAQGAWSSRRSKPD